MAFRDIPTDIVYREREHHPICAWCRCQWTGKASGISWCDAKTLGAFSDMTSMRNPHGRCDDYAPSTMTRALQVVRIRPLVERH